jgi:hypothetical protein
MAFWFPVLIVGQSEAVDIKLRRGCFVLLFRRFHIFQYKPDFGIAKVIAKS